MALAPAFSSNVIKKRLEVAQYQIYIPCESFSILFLLESHLPVMANYELDNLLSPTQTFLSKTFVVSCLS